MTALERFPFLHSVRADPCALVVTYLAFRFDMMGGVLTALILGLTLDTMSGAPSGLHMMSLELLFVLMRIVANAIQLQPGVRVLPVAVAGALFHASLVTFMVGVFGEGSVKIALWQSSVPSVLCNLVVGLPLLVLLNNFADRVMPESDHMFSAR